MNLLGMHARDSGVGVSLRRVRASTLAFLWVRLGRRVPLTTTLLRHMSERFPSGFVTKNVLGELKGALEPLEYNRERPENVSDFTHFSREKFARAHLCAAFCLVT